MRAILAALSDFLLYLSRPLVPPAAALTWMLASTPAAVAVGLVLGKWWLPVLQALAFYPLFIGLLMRNHWRRAMLAAMGWALWTAVLVAGISQTFPELARQRILLAGSYQAEMFHWIQTGVGKEGDIRLFLPEHLWHLAGFTLLTVLSAGLLGLVMGSVLMDYMSCYVGTLLLHGSGLSPLLLYAWPPWAALRVAAYILLATGLSAWLLNRLGVGTVSCSPLKRCLVAGLTLIASDILLKWLLAPFWQQRLLELTSWG